MQEAPNRLLLLAPLQSSALHELGTNAIKYGALSTPLGRIDITWRQTGINRSALFQFRWQEKNGPLVAKPSRQST